MAKKQRSDTSLTVAQSRDEAMNYIFIGFKYFIVNDTWTTLTIMVAILAGLGMFFRDYLTMDRITIEDVKPVGRPSSGLFQAEPFALYAQQKGAKMIELGGLEYAELDPDWEIYKVKGENAVLVWHKPSGTVKKIEIPFNKLK